MQDTIEARPTRRAGRREWIGLLVLALPCLLYSMDLTVLNLALPAITAALHPSSTELLWIVDIYGFLLAGSLITMGTIGDRIGRRRLLLIGAAAFGIASTVAAFSTSAEMLIVSRALLGIAGATLAPSTLSLIRTMFRDDRQRLVAIGVWGTSFSLGGAIGPLVGGALLERFWWGSAFLVAVPVMVLLLIVGPRLLPEYRDPDAGRPDIASAVLSVLAVLAVIFGLKQIAQDGPALVPALSIVAGLLVGVAFVRRQKTLARPMIDLDLFRMPAFSVSVAAFALLLFVTFGTMLFMAQYLQLVAGLSPLAAGVWMLPSGIGAVSGSLLVPVIQRRLRPVTTMVTGLFLMTFAFALLTQVDGASGLGLVVASSVALTLGGTLAGLSATGLIVGMAPVEHAGIVAAISQTSGELGGAVGIAILGSVGTAVYRGLMVGSIPAGVSPDAADVARATLGGAVAVAVRLPGEVGASLLDVARASFSQGLHVAAGANVVIAVGLAVLLTVMLRKPAGAASDVEADDPDRIEKMYWDGFLAA